MTSTGAESMTARGWWMAAVFAFAGFLSYTDRLILSSLVDQVKFSLSISDSEVALLQGAAFALVYIIAGLFFGRLADRLRTRVPLLVAASSLWCLGTIACGLANSFEALFLARMVVGVGEAALAPAAIAMLAATVPPTRLATAVGAFVMGTIVGGPGAIAVGGGLLDFFQSTPAISTLEAWRMVLVTAGASGIVLPLLFLTLRDPPRSSQDIAASLPEALTEFRSRFSSLLPIYGGLALLSIGDFGLLTWSPSLLTRSFDYSPSTIALIFGIGTTVAGVIGSVAGGALLDWLGRRSGIDRPFRFIVVLAVIAAVTAAMLALPSSLLVVAGVLGWTLSSAVVAVGGIAAIQRLVPGHCRGLAMSFVSFFAILIGLGFGPSLIAGVTDGIYGRPEAIGSSIAIVVAPAALMGAALFEATRRSLQNQWEKI